MVQADQQNAKANEQQISVSFFGFDCTVSVSITFFFLAVLRGLKLHVIQRCLLNLLPFGLFARIF